MAVSSIDVVTEDLHARRTRLLFQKAFGKGVQVGVIAVANVDYPANRWWHYSQGLKDVVSEFAAYLYSRLFFWPTPEGGQRTESREQRADGRAYASLARPFIREISAIRGRKTWLLI
jgi:hypothetical protein